MIAVLMPMSSPRSFTSAPPELPGLIGAVCLDEILIILDAEVSAIHGADNSLVTVCPTPKGISDGQRVVAHLDF